MTKWYEIIEPHEDIKKGDFDESVFAADLGNVANGTAPADYADPFLFFKKTYFTHGITNLLVKVYNKLNEGKGSSVIEIRTPFGGGKTHALISIHHYLKNGQKVADHLPKGCEIIDSKIAVIVGTHLNPLEGHEREGIHIYTLWGEMAYQLGGEEGYRKFERNDAEKISPGKEKLKAFLETKEPFVLLFDEILEYVAKARGVSYSNTNLGTQTYAFFQELTETVSSLRRGMMIVTLPSSYLEDYTEREEESLAKLDKIFMRVESIETPVKGEEMYSIITRRLFSDISRTEERDQIIYQYFQLYQKHKDELPVKVRDIDYRRKMELAYPFHPEVIDILYERWGTFSSFQRTRGVLRLLANVIEDLYIKEKNLDLILPSDIDLDAPSVRQEFLRHIGSEYESIIGSDISGHEAKAIVLDKQNKSWNHLAERISTAIFLYSFTADKSKKGSTLEYIKFVAIHQDTLPPMVTEVLQKLNKSLWYLNEKGEMYYFSKIPNLNRMILDKKELYNEAYEDKLKQIHKKEVGNAFVSYLWPTGSESIPDTKDIKLIILHPNSQEKIAAEWLEKRGLTFRTYKNILIFALADPGGFGNLKEQIKTYLALNEIKRGIESGEEESLKEKLPEVKQRIKQIEDDFSYNARKMYNMIIVGDEKISLGEPTVGKESLSNWYKRELEANEKLVNNLHYRVLVNKFLLDKDRLGTRTIMEQFYKDTSLCIPASQKVLQRMIQTGVSEGAFGIGFIQNEDVEKDTFKFNTNIATSSVTFDEKEIILSKELSLKYQEQFEKEKEEEKGKVEEIEEVKEVEKVEEVKEVEKVEEAPTRFKKIFLRVENINSTKIADLNRGVFLPISQEIGSFDLILEIDLQHPEGILASTLQNKIKETISQIGAKLTKEKLE